MSNGVICSRIDDLSFTSGSRSLRKQPGFPLQQANGRNSRPLSTGGGGASPCFWSRGTRCRFLCESPRANFKGCRRFGSAKHVFCQIGCAWKETLHSLARWTSRKAYFANSSDKESSARRHRSMLFTQTGTGSRDLPNISARCLVNIHQSHQLCRKQVPPSLHWKKFTRKWENSL